MATKWISPTWRMPEESNQSKFENYSLDFDGTQYIDCGNDSIFNNTFTGNAFSFSVWIKSSSNVAYDGILNFSSRVQSFLNSNKIKIWLQGSSGYVVTAFTSNTTILSDTWYHIVFTRNGNDNTLYINGVSDNTVTSSGDVATTTGTFKIGTYDGGQYFWDGNLTEVSIFDYALTDGTGGTQDQITALYNSGTPINPVAITPPPITYYPLGGSSTGSSSTLTIPNESVPSATVFDFPSGGADLINCGNKVDFTNAFTLSSWVKTDTTAASYIFYKNATFTVGKDTWYDGGVGNRARVTLTDSNGLSKNFRSNVAPTGATVTVGTVVDLKDGNWHQIVFSYDGVNQGKLYTDGALTYTYDITDGAWAGSLASNTNDLILGSNVTVQTWTGEMSNTQIWESVLTGTEVTTLYNNGVPFTGTQPQAANLKAWYKMNVDTSTWDGSDWIIGEAQANYSSALSFDGADTVDLPDITFLRDGGQNFSISAWVNTTSGTQVGYFGARVAPSVTNTIDFYRNTNGALIFGINNSSTGNIVATGTSSALTNNKWYHIAATFDGTEGTAADRIKLYINGELDANSTSGTGTNLPSGSTGIFNTIGKIFIGILQTGDMSNVGIWSSTLDASAITALYNNGTPEASISSSPQAWWKLDSTTITDSSGNGNNGTNSGTTVTDIQVSTLNGTSSGMTTANLVNSDLTRSIPYSSYSMAFDGIDDEINFSSTNDLGLNNTVSMWVNLDSGYSGALLGESSYGSTGYFLLPYATGFLIRIGTTSASASNVHTYLTAGSWHNLTVVRNAGNFLFYVDGAFIETVALSSTTTTKFDIIGNSHTGADPIEGKISNVCGFNSILTEDQILTIYNGGVPNDISSFSPTGWWSLAGDSYYDGTNWICPDLGSGSNNGTSAAMGGTELVGDGPGSTANGIATSMDIPANLKGNAPNSSKNAFSINMNSADRVEDVPA